MKPILMLILAVSLVAGIAPAAENPNDLFQQALVKERTEGNCQRLSSSTRRLVRQNCKQPQGRLGKALLGLAGCRPNWPMSRRESRLERLVRDFSRTRKRPWRRRG